MSTTELKFDSFDTQIGETAGKVRVEKSSEVTHNGIEYEHGAVYYQKRDDAWYIRKEDEDKYRRFAKKTADERTIRQLIFKKYCDSYGGSWEEDA